MNGHAVLKILVPLVLTVLTGGCSPSGSTYESGEVTKVDTFRPIPSTPTPVPKPSPLPSLEIKTTDLIAIHGYIAKQNRLFVPPGGPAPDTDTQLLLAGVLLHSAIDELDVRGPGGRSLNPEEVFRIFKILFNSNGQLKSDPKQP